MSSASAADDLKTKKGGVSGKKGGSQKKNALAANKNC
jgi:hypothetical protein